MKHLLFVLFALLAASAAAQERRPYVFGSALQEVDFKVGDVRDSTKSLLYLGAGYRWKYAAAELSYFQPSAFQHSASVTQGGTTFSTFRTWKVWGVGLSALGMVPIGEHFAIFGKAGAYGAQTRLSTQHVAFTPPSTTSATREKEESWGLSPTIGLGLTLSAGGMQIRALAERMYSEEFDTMTTKTLQLGLSF